MTRMRAAVLRSPGELGVEVVELEPPRRGEVLVRMEAAGVCHTDLHYLKGDLSCPLPAVLGHEGAGVVAEVGDDVTELRAGDRVTLMWRPRCGRCPACLRGNPIQCALGPVQASTGGLPDGTSRLSHDGRTVHHFLGASCFADFAVVSAGSVVRVPDDVPAQVAAITGCAVVTGVGTMLNVVQGAAGRPLVIFGAGGVGLSCLLGARLTGATPLTVVDIDARKLELAEALGADHVVDAGAGDAAGQLRALLPDGAAWAIDAVGSARTLEQALACLAPGGTVAALGLNAVGATFPMPINDVVQRQKTIVGCLYGAANPHIDIPRIFGLYRSGLLPLDTLLGDTYRLDQIGEAYRQLAAGAVGRAVVSWLP